MTEAEQDQILIQSSKVVEKYISNDETQQKFEDLLRLGSYDKDKATFNKVKTIPLPPVILDEYEKIQYSCFMGLFPEIGRAWISMDSRLFLWNYEDKTEFVEYSELEQIILSVGLVTPKKGIFKEFVKHLLVIATPAEVVFVAVSFGGEGQNEITLFETNYSISTDGVKMLKIVGTRQGRIFLCGDDGCLYELDYYPEEGWLTKSKVKKSNHSQSFFGVLIPSFLKFTHDDPIKDMVLDSTRNVLYTLSENSHIEVFDLGADETSTYKVCTYTKFLSDARQRDRDLRENIKLVSISPILKHESKYYHFVAVSSSGHRFYFSTSDGESTPEFCKLVDHSNSLLTDPLRRVSHFFYRHGVFVMSGPNGDESGQQDPSDTILAISVEFGGFDQEKPSSGKKCRKIYSFIDLKEKIHAISELPSPFPFLYQRQAHLDELVTQLMKPQREFVTLSNKGVQIFAKPRPVDILLSILSDKNPDPKAFSTLVEKYQKSEVIVMLLHILCSRFLDDPDMAQRASKRIKEIGGEPEYKRETEQVVYSPARNGWFSYFARLIRPIWKHLVIHVENDKSFHLRFDSNEMMQLAKNLRFLHQNLKQVFDTFHFEPNKQDSDLANTLEKKSLLGLSRMVDRCIQIIHVLNLFTEPKLLNQFEKINVLKQKAFKDFVIPSKTNDEKEIVFKLIQLMIEKGNLEQLEEKLISLGTDCKEFFGRDDIEKLSAKNLLKKAEKSNPKDKIKLQEEALFKLKNCLLSMSELSDFVDDYVRLYSDSVAVQLALLQADLVNNSKLKMSSNEIQARQEAAYKEAITILSYLISDKTKSSRSREDKNRELDRVLTICQYSKDPNFHNYLYSHVLHDDTIQNVIFSWKSPFLEKFLIDSENYALLYKYYDKHQMNDKAAKILKIMSQRDNTNLENRIEFLSASIIYNKSNRISEGLEEDQETLDIAQVQKGVKEEIAKLDPKSSILADLDTRLWELSALWKLTKDYKLDSRILVLQCANEANPALVASVWREILDEGRAREQGFTNLLNFYDEKLTKFGEILYGETNHDDYFPLAVIADLLIKKTVEKRWDDLFVYNRFKAIQISYRDLFDAYSSLLNDSQGISGPKAYSSSEKRAILLSLCQIISDWIEDTCEFTTDQDYKFFPTKSIDAQLNRMDQAVGLLDNQDQRDIKVKVFDLKKKINDTK